MKVYIITVEETAHEVSYEGLARFCFALKCDKKEFSITYPGGYVGVFKPPLNEN